MVKNIVEKTISDFCKEFIEHPYLCYTEHGLHARFYHQLYKALPPNLRYTELDGKKICTVQKEYPTADALEKPQRQHWDIAVIQTPLSSHIGKTPTYDYLTLDSVVEFGLNATREHLVDDIDRLCHPNSNVKNRYIAHFYRLSNKISNRDWSPKSKQLLNINEIYRLVQNRDITIFFCVFDDTNRVESDAWHVTRNNITPIRRSSVTDL